MPPPKADPLEALRAELARKRKLAAEQTVEVGGTKVIRGADVEAKREDEYRQKQQLKADEKKSGSGAGDAQVAGPSNEQSAIDDINGLARPEAIRRLRTRGLPVRLFGESDEDAVRRLRKHELEQPEMSEGWKNELQSAMKEVDAELVREVIEGKPEDDDTKAQKHDVHVPGEEDALDWVTLEQEAPLLGASDDATRDCRTIHAFMTHILSKWARQLNDRPHEEKKSNTGKLEASVHKQTLQHLRPLLSMLTNRTVNHDIRHHLCKIIRLIVVDRNYIQANNAYMEMAIGNAPWPVGVTRSGLHQRPGSAKSYVSNVAHVLNDETQRKYIQSFKRLITRAQDFYPTDPSKCVEFVKKDDPIAAAMAASAR